MYAEDFISLAPAFLPPPPALFPFEVDPSALPASPLHILRGHTRVPSIHTQLHRQPLTKHETVNFNSDVKLYIFSIELAGSEKTQGR